MTYDQINPDHYQFSNGAEVIDITENLNFNLGNVVKYTARAGRKPGADKLTELNKAKWYLEREIDRAEAEQINGASPTVTDKLTDHPTYTGRVWRDSTGHLLRWSSEHGWMRFTAKRGWQKWSDNEAGLFPPYTEAVIHDRDMFDEPVIW